MAGGFSKEFIEQVRNACDIVQVIETYVPLKKSGANYKALSPFNKEKTPSFFVSPQRQLFKCFSSGNGGDVFKFVMLYESLDFPAAVRRLAERAGIPLPQEGMDGEREDRGQREQLFQIHSAVAAWWAQLLRKSPEGEPARKYLQSRQISSDLAREFGLGYAPDRWDATIQWAKEQGFRPQILELAGLVTVHESGKRYDRFRGRLMFPIANESGQVVAFSGRLLDPEAKAAKYVNSPETPIFTKSKILFGLDKTKRAILEQKTALVCEGQLDLMRCYEKGIRYTVAPQGTAFTEHHARLLKRFAEEVVLCFDADRAGQSAAERSVDVLVQAGLSVRIATIPGGDDPDSFLRHRSAEEFLAILRKAPEYTQHLLDSYCSNQDIQSPKGRQFVAEKMAEVVGKIPSEVARQTVALRVATRLQIPLSAFSAEMTKAQPRMARTDSEAGMAAPMVEPPTVAAPISHLLMVLLHHPDWVPMIQRQVDPRWLTTLEGGEILQHFFDSYTHEEWETEQEFLELCEENVRSYLIGLLLTPLEFNHEVTVEKYCASLLVSMEQLWKRRRTAILEQEIKSNLLDLKELQEKSKELLELKKTRA